MNAMLTLGTKIIYIYILPIKKKKQKSNNF